VRHWQIVAINLYEQSGRGEVIARNIWNQFLSKHQSDKEFHGRSKARRARMVDELWDSKTVTEFLEINLNNLRQLQYRKSIAWVKKESRSVFYRADEVRAYKEKRDKRKAIN